MDGFIKVIIETCTHLRCVGELSLFTVKDKLHNFSLAKIIHFISTFAVIKHHLETHTYLGKSVGKLSPFTVKGKS